MTLLELPLFELALIEVIFESDRNLPPDPET